MEIAFEDKESMVNAMCLRTIYLKTSPIGLDEKELDTPSTSDAESYPRPSNNKSHIAGQLSQQKECTVGLMSVGSDQSTNVKEWIELLKYEAEGPDSSCRLTRELCAPDFPSLFGMPMWRKSTYTSCC